MIVTTKHGCKVFKPDPPALPTPPAFQGVPEPGHVYQCDALALLKAMPDNSVDAIITDPPYGLAKYKPLEVAPGKRNGHGGAYKRVNEEWDLDVPVDWMPEATRVLRPGGSVIIFNGVIGRIEIGFYALQLGWRLLAEIAWFKPDAPPNFTGRCVSQSTEKFFWYCPSGSNWTYNRKYAKQVNGGVNFRDVWTFHAPRGEDRLHPTQKPFLLMDRIVQLFTKSGDLIVDPFGGSGTTAVAARNAGRRYITGDLSATYCDIMRRRLSEAFTVNMFETPSTESEKAEQQSIFDAA